MIRLKEYRGEPKETEVVANMPKKKTEAVDITPKRMEIQTEAKKRLLHEKEPGISKKEKIDSGEDNRKIFNTVTSAFFSLLTLYPIGQAIYNGMTSPSLMNSLLNVAMQNPIIAGLTLGAFTASTLNLTDVRQKKKEFEAGWENVKESATLTVGGALFAAAGLALGSPTLIMSSAAVAGIGALNLVQNGLHKMYERATGKNEERIQESASEESTHMKEDAPRISLPSQVASSGLAAVAMFAVSLNRDLITYGTYLAGKYYVPAMFFTALAIGGTAGAFLNLVNRKSDGEERLGVGKSALLVASGIALTGLVTYAWNMPLTFTQLATISFLGGAFMGVGAGDMVRRGAEHFIDLLQDAWDALRQKKPLEEMHFLLQLV